MTGDESRRAVAPRPLPRPVGLEVGALPALAKLLGVLDRAMFVDAGGEPASGLEVFESLDDLEVREILETPHGPLGFFEAIEAQDL